MTSDIERKSIHTLYSILSMRHSVMMRKAMNHEDSVDARLAIAMEMSEYLSASMMLMQEQYNEFAEWFTNNTPADVQQICYDSVSSEM